MMRSIEAGIVGRDHDGLVAFYTDVLEFEVVDRLEFDEGVLVKLRRGDGRFKIFFPRSGSLPPAVTDPYWAQSGWRYAALVFDDRDDMHRTFARIEASGGRVVMAPRSHRPGAEAALVADPEDNHWELLWDTT